MVFNNSILLGAAGQSGAATFDTTLIGNSVWLDGSADYFSRTYAGSGNSTTEAIFSFWYQRYNFGVAQSTWFEASGFGGLQTNTSYGGGDTLVVNSFDAGGTQVIARHTRLLRDISWYHIIVSIDMSQGSTLDKIKFYINGEQDTTINVQNLATTNGLDMLGARSKVSFRIGENTGSTGHAYAQYCYLDGVSIQQGDYAVSDFLDTFTFGTNGSQYVPKADADIAALATTAGGNSFCLDFANSADLGNDISSNANDFTANSISSVNQSSSTPSNVHSKFNPLDHDTAATITLSNGNSTLAMTTANWKHARTSLPFPDESYCEVVLDARSAAGRMYVGLATGSYNVYSTSPPNTTDSAKRCIYSDSGTFYDFSDTSGTSYTSASLTDVLQVYRKGSNFYIGINGTWVNSADPDADTNPISSSIPSENVFLFVGGYSGETYTLRTEASEWTASNRPASAKAVNTANQTAPDYQGIDYFDSTLYEGNGTGQRVGDFVPFTDSYAVTNSVMFEDGDSRSLTLNSSATRTSATVAAFSLWTKRANLGTNQRPLTVQVDGSNYFSIYYNTSDQLDFTINNGGATILQRITNRVFKDNSAWHNIVVIINQGESTQADRVKVFYDGVQIPNDSTGFGTNTCTLDGSSALNFLDSASAVHDVGGGSSTGFTQPYDGYVSEVAFLDGADSGAKLNASDFGQVDTSTNRWVPKDIGSYNFGNTGYYLEFKVAPGTGNGAGTDTSGESNNFTSNGSWATTDQFTDCPSQNFNVFDTGLNAMGTLSEGGTKIVTATNNKAAYTTMNIPSTGKWYWEVDVTSYASGGGSYFGLHEHDELNTGSAGVTSTAVIFQNYNGTANVYDSSNTDVTWCNSVSNNGFVSSGDVLQFALDQDAGTLFIGNNNTWFRAGGARDTFANATTVGTKKFPTGISRRFFVGRGGSFAETYALNFGQQSSEFSGSSTTFNAAADGFFVYTPPTGYKALNQDNLDDTASKITAWAWIKNRDSTDSHMLIDRVRGVGVEVHTDGTTTTPETTNTNTVQRFLQRGVQVGNDVQVNTANESYVLWQWLIGDSATTGTTNEDGSLDSTVIAADAGHFSVVSWTGNETLGATIGHGLGGTPEFIIAIARAESGENKPVYHKFMTADTDHLKINESNAQGTAGTTIWDVSAMSSTLIGLGAAVQSNSNNGMIAYCFRSVPGVCKVGEYTGNGSSDGPYISTGFKPKWLMVKWTGGGGLSGEGWVIKDTARQTFNPNDDADIYANFTTAESAGATHGADILADGFKLRGTGGANNGNGATYLYLAIADIGGNGTLPPIYGR